MKKLIFTTFYILILIKIFAQADSLTQAVQIEPIIFKENIQIKGFHILDTYKLPDDDLFAVGRPIEQVIYLKGVRIWRGLRVFYLTKYNSKYQIKFKSEDFVDSYIAQPSFFQLDSNRILILIESGDENSWGFGVYIKENQKIKHIGELDVASYNNYDQLNTLARTKIFYKPDKDYLEFKLSGKIVLHPSTDKEQILDGKTVKYTWNGNKLYYIITK